VKAFVVSDYPVFCVHQAPVLVIGSGVAGLLTALKLAKKEIHCLLVTKTNLAESNTRYAQGGIAAVLPHNTKDSIELHVQDTLKAGAGLCNEPVVRSFLAEGAAAIDDLLELGVAFDKEAFPDSHHSKPPRQDKLAPGVLVVGLLF
jgi:L-aspartate oxidase